MAQRVKNHSVVCEGWVRSLISLSGLRMWHCHKLWHRLQMQLGSGIAMTVAKAAAAVLIHPLAQELPYDVGVTIKKEVLI